MIAYTNKTKQNKQWIEHLISECKWRQFGKRLRPFESRNEEWTPKNMHKKNLCRNTDSIRIARATQVRLDEISNRIEREKHRSIKSNYYERIKVWNELKSIHRVFEPLYVIKENRERLARNQSPAPKLAAEQNVGICAGDNRKKELGANAFVKEPRLLRRAKTQSGLALNSARRHTEPEVKFGVQSANCRDQSQNPWLLRPRSQSWAPSSRIEPQGLSSVPQKSEREHLAKLRNATEEPHVSDSMSSVTMGYLAFKRVLKNKRQSECRECKVVDSRFRSMSMDEAELSANSRMVMPEQTKRSTDEKEDSLPGMFSTQTNPHLVKKDNKAKPYSNRHRSTRAGSRRQLVSSLSWPLGELPTRSPEARRTSLLTPDLLRAKSTEVPRSRSKMSSKERPASERTKMGKASGSNLRERSSESDEEDQFGTFDETSSEDIKLRRLNKGFLRGSKLLNPLGTGCFSKSFQSASQ